MGVTTLDLFGSDNTAHPAALGEYGEAPKGYRLPASTRLGAVQLQIGDLARSLRYYQKTLGLYNYAILLPDRASLGRFVQHLADINTYAGSGDRPDERGIPSHGSLRSWHFSVCGPPARHVKTSRPRADDRHGLCRRSRSHTVGWRRAVDWYAGRHRDWPRASPRRRPELGSGVLL